MLCPEKGVLHLLLLATQGQFILTSLRCSPAPSTLFELGAQTCPCKTASSLSRNSAIRFSHCAASASKSGCHTAATALSAASARDSISSSICCLSAALVASWSACSLSSRRALRASSSPSSLSSSSSPTVFARRRRERNARGGGGRTVWAGLGPAFARRSAHVFAALTVAALLALGSATVMPDTLFLY